MFKGDLNNIKEIWEAYITGGVEVEEDMNLRRFLLKEFITDDLNGSLDG